VYVQISDSLVRLII